VPAAVTIGVLEEAIGRDQGAGVLRGDVAVARGELTDPVTRVPNHPGVHFVVSSEVPSNSSLKIRFQLPLWPNGCGTDGEDVGDGDGDGDGEGLVEGLGPGFVAENGVGDGQNSGWPGLHLNVGASADAIGAHAEDITTGPAGRAFAWEIPPAGNEWIAVRTAVTPPSYCRNR
jgi:hypothetical protein